MSASVELRLYVPEWVREKVEHRNILEAKARRIRDEGLPESVVSVWSEIKSIDRHLSLWLVHRVSRLGEYDV